MTKYTFYEDSWWDYNGCSCCDPSWMEAYNSDDTLCGMGTAHSEEDCYIQAILTELGEGYSTETADSLYELDIDTLKEKAKLLGVEVEIVYDS